jgi:hypothetical protein
VLDEKITVALLIGVDGALLASAVSPGNAKTKVSV